MFLTFFSQSALDDTNVELCDITLRDFTISTIPMFINGTYRFNKLNKIMIINCEVEKVFQVFGNVTFIIQKMSAISLKRLLANSNDSRVEMLRPDLETEEVRRIATIFSAPRTENDKKWSFKIDSIIHFITEYKSLEDIVRFLEELGTDLDEPEFISFSKIHLHRRLFLAEQGFIEFYEDSPSVGTTLMARSVERATRIFLQHDLTLKAAEMILAEPYFC